MQENGTEGVKLDFDWETFLAPNDMEWVVKPVSWDEGAFIGNGLIGAMIYGEENARKRHVLRLVTGRTDVMASRTDATGFPPRVPIGELDLELEGMIYHPTRLRLDLWNAELIGSATTTRGEVRLRAFVHSEENVMAVETEASEGERAHRFVWYERANVDPVLIYADGVNVNQFIPEADIARLDKDGIAVSVQRYKTEEGCVTAWKEVRLSEARRVCYLSVARGCGDAAVREAVQAVAKAAGADYGQWLQAHRSWWHRYYRQSFVSIPDGRLESFYWIQMYKLASATRADKPLIDNQGPWLAPTPWAGVWFNMNVQMSYSPVYTSNRLEIGESLVRSIEEHQEQLIRNVPEAYRHDSAGLGRSCSFDLDSKVEDEVGNLTWVCHNLWRQYRYSMDDDMLRRVLVPVLRRSVNYYAHLLEEGEDGRWHLPPTVSPEYGSFMKTRVRDCHYDLALLRWGCETLLAVSGRLGESDPLEERWRSILERLVPLPADDSGFMVGENTPLAYGHRHFSHLLAVFPLHLIGCDDEAERELIARSLEHWIGKEGDLRGFSLTGAASIAAVLGRGGEALGYLQALLHIVKPNTMYKEAGPVIETPLAGAESLQDMLLQSWGDTIRVFPAVPDEWQDAAFHDLRAEGAFLVSAVREGGRTRWVRVKSLAGEPCVVKTDWTGTVMCKLTGTDREAAANGQEGGFIRLQLRRGEEALLYPEGEQPDFVIRPVSAGAAGRPIRPFGGHKPWRWFGFPRHIE
ncbi:hypothetical protein N0M98_12080 [Paenibacillus doosanensis]|uniref:glycosyl hydrolase family 95 catalytic domain-containing protein n=1 Tax=Paenibacillus doosanensis TaxID=1229154 RepID=UPI0021808DB5|nr:hypothetical protein [Paenibacillus doosanensis]MCS7460881.1 hypothetical protein [Paenibacillus doosanensis]